MLSILLSILKIIGWILLIVLVVLVTLLLLVLLVPIRYRAEIKKDDEIFVLTRFTWLLRIVYVKFVYVTGKLLLRIHIFGVCIYDNGRPKKEKKEKNKKKKRTKNKSEKKDESVTAVKLANPVELKDEQLPQASISHDFVNEDKDKQKKKNSFSEKISHAKETIKGFKNKKDSLVGFIKTEENKVAFVHVLAIVKKLFMHTKPKKITGYIEYGLDDPALTGEITGLLSLLLSFYPEKLRLTPNFEEKVFNAEITCYGRIRMIHLLIITVGAFKDKEIKKLIRNAKKLKEEI